MSQGTELLNSLTEEEIAAYSVDPSTEEHIVIGSNKVITVPVALQQINVQYEHNVETVTFDCPRYWDGHDMSKWAVYINYTLSNGYEDSYIADNVVVDDTDESVMHFEWTISRNVTQVTGIVTFSVCIKETDEESNEIRHWNSKKNTQMSISAGMECTEKVVDENSDLIGQLLDRMGEVETLLGNPIKVTSADEMDAILASATEASVGKVYLYAGETTDTYENGEMYVLKESE